MPPHLKDSLCERDLQDEFHKGTGRHLDILMGKGVNGIGPSYIIFLIYVRPICVVQGINPLSVQAFIVAH
jgi:hypothetical protein